MYRVEDTYQIQLLNTTRSSTSRGLARHQLWTGRKSDPFVQKIFLYPRKYEENLLPQMSWLSTLPRHTGKCLTWILLLPRHPTWILHLPRRRRGSFTFLVTQEVNNVDNTYILVANVDSIVSSSHRNCTTWIFKHPRLSSWIFKVPRHTEIS